MLIILEGPDGSGKTTLSNKLCERPNVVKISNISKESPFQYIMWNNLMSACAKDKTKTYVMDRCFLTDWAYRIAMNDSSPIMYLYEMLELLNIKDVTYVFCENTNSYELSMERGEDYVTSIDEHNKVKSAYEFIFNTIDKYCVDNLNLVKYNFMTDSFEKLCNILKV